MIQSRNKSNSPYVNIQTPTANSNYVDDDDEDDDEYETAYPIFKQNNSNS